ncbi:MAG TPA: MFS transporter [Euzebyales bacterium]
MTRVHLHGWRHPSIIAVALLAVATGFAQFAPTASLSDVATAFGEDAATTAEQVGLSATTVGIGLAIIRFASLAALPIASVADRLGRRRVLLWCVGTGLLLTSVAALSPSFWWFVAVVAISRPLFSATTAVGSVVASEEVRSADRTKAIALAVAGYAVGTGIVSVVRVPLNDLLGGGFRGVFALAVVFLVLLPLLAPMLAEPDRFKALRARRAAVETRPRLSAFGSIHPRLRRRLLLLVIVTFTFNVVTGPHNTYLFFYGEGQLGLSRATMAVLVIVSGPVGLVGLLIGRWISDRLGRRPAVIGFHLLVAASVALAYSGSTVALVSGFWAGIFAQGAYGPGFGALSTEVFPTSIRATTQGWVAAAGVLGAVAGLVLFGTLSDITGSFAMASVSVGALAAMTAAGYRWFPETRGLELEESAPEIDDDPADEDLAAAPTPEHDGRR